MEFTKENVVKCWYILNQSSSMWEKEEANNYLLSFQNSPSVTTICYALFHTEDVNHKLISSFLLYSHIRNHFNEIIQNRALWNELKTEIFTSIIPKLEACSTITVEKVCCGISILVLVGWISSNWHTSIEDILQFSSNSDRNCWYSLIILSNIQAEYDSLSFTQKDKLKIKDWLIDKKNNILVFINTVIKQIKAISTENINKNMSSKLFELLSTWVSFDWSILQYKALVEYFLQEINIDNIDKVSELFCQIISTSKSSKMYNDFSPDIDQAEKEFFDSISEKVIPSEIESLYLIISMVNNFVVNYNPNNDIDDTYLMKIANIFASVCENYIYLFFIRNEHSQKILTWFDGFITHRKRKISYKFFETICEMREFINRYYKFCNLNNEEKQQFIAYLLKIVKNIMINSKLKTLDVNYDWMLKTDVLCLNNSDNQGNDTMNKTANENDIEDDPNEVNVTDYRKNAEDVFYNIFLIIVGNFGNEGAKWFWNEIMNIFTMANINDASIINDNNRLLAVETAFFVMKSIIDSFEALNIAEDSVLNFINMILSSQLLKDRKMVVNFLLYLDQATSFIPKNQDIYINTVSFLLLVAKEKILEKIATLIISNIIPFSEGGNANIFKMIYEDFIANYDWYDNSDTIANLSIALCDAICICKPSNKTELRNMENIDNLYVQFSQVLQPATERIKNIHNYIMSNNKDAPNNSSNKEKWIKLEILKSYNVHQNTLSKSKEINKRLFYLLFSLHFKETFPTTNALFERYSNNEKFVISEITNIYIRNIDAWEDYKIEFFTDWNMWMLSTINSSPQNFRCLVLLKKLYTPINLKHTPEVNATIIPIFFNWCNIYFHAIASETSNKIEMLSTFADFFDCVFPHLNFLGVALHGDHLNIWYNIINLFIMGLQYNTENNVIKTTISALGNFISNSNLQAEWRMNKYIDIVRVVLGIMDKYDSYVMSKFKVFVSNCIGVDKGKFWEVWNEILMSNDFQQQFNANYIKLIIDYWTAFGNNDIKWEAILKYIVEIRQKRSRWDSLNYFGMEVARLKILKK